MEIKKETQTIDQHITAIVNSVQNLRSWIDTQPNIKKTWIILAIRWLNDLETLCEAEQILNKWEEPNQ